MRCVEDDGAGSYSGRARSATSGKCARAAYYTRAHDKRQAIHDVLNIGDYPAFLAASGLATHGGAATSR